MIESILSGDSDFVWLALKLVILFCLSMYIVFAFVVVKQVKLMNETLEIGFEEPIKIISFVHMFIAIFVFVLAVIIL